MSKDLMELIGECQIYETDVLEPKGQEVIEKYRKLGFTKATEEPYQKNLEISKRQRIYEFEYRVITTEAIRKFLQRKVTLYDKEHKPKVAKKSSCNSIPIPHEEHGIFVKTLVERMKEELIHSCAIPSVFLGRPDHSASGALQQLAIHRQAERDQQRETYEALNAVNDSNPTWVMRLPEAPRSGLLPLGSEDRLPWGIYEKTCDFDKFDSKTIGRFSWKEERVEDYEGLPPAPVIETFKEHKARKVFDYFTIASVNSVPDPLLLGRINGDDDNRWFIAQWGADVCLDDLI